MKHLNRRDEPGDRSPTAELVFLPLSFAETGVTLKDENRVPASSLFKFGATERARSRKQKNGFLPNRIAAVAFIVRAMGKRVPMQEMQVVDTAIPIRTNPYSLIAKGSGGAYFSLE